MKNEFIEGQPYITQFAVLHPFLRRLKILLIFIRYLTLIKTNLVKQKILVFHFE